eukprot:c27519_g1_i1 orf=702-3170(-)
MADVLDLPPEPLLHDERRRERTVERKDRSIEERRRDRDPRERREERVVRDERDERQPRREYHEKRPSQEERSNSGLLENRRDRDRDYKRRKSPSPPPYPLRDRERRYSPSRRSPSYKRSRREDEYELGRRGSSPRSGMVPMDDLGRASGYDRRYAYEGLASYEKLGTVGGRGTSYSADERSHGRHLGSRSDWPGSGHPGFIDGIYSHGGAPRREGLMTYKQFIAELEDDILPAEAQRRYEEYKNEFISTQKRNFFELNKDEEWLREKYDPSRLEAVIQRRNENCRKIAKELIAELEAGILDVGPSATGKNMQDGEHMSDEETDVAAKRRRSGRAPVKEIKSDPTSKAPIIKSDSKRTVRDIEQARALIRKMDSEKGIEGNILVTPGEEKGEGEKPLGGTGLDPIIIVRGANQVKGYEGMELLDVLLTYLWRVHSVDYYGMSEYKELPKGFRHVRAEGKNNDDPAVAVEWEKKLDLTWQTRLQGQDPLENMLGKEKMETTLIDALDQHVRKIRDEKYGWKYGCGAKGCTKLFHGPEYVHKHLKLKHSELVNDSMSKVREELYFQNYMSDLDAPGGTPIMSQPDLRDRARKQRHGLSGTVRDDSGSPAEQVGGLKGSSGFHLSGSSRGSRGTERLDRGGRDRERYERVREEERFDRGAELSPSRDYPQGLSPQTMSGGPYDVSGPYEGGRSEAGMFNPFSGSGMHEPPRFGSDLSMPPPVLMPVPGAGPLGPFVPAPPEVAMRLMREQGGGPPFHPGAYDGEAGGMRSRKGRGPSTGPMGAGMLDTPMILPLTPAVRHDPRHLRSYRDLDAPEDEVSVIDYRSL